MTGKDNPFEGLADEKVTLNVNGTDLTIKPAVKHAKALMVLKPGSQDGIDKFEQITREMLTEAYPNAKKEDLEIFLSRNLSTLMNEMMILYGMVTREELEGVKSQVKKNIEENLEQKNKG